MKVITYKSNLNTRVSKAEKLSRRHDLAIHHFVVHRELGEVKVGIFASELLQSRSKAEGENLGSFKLKLVDLCLEPIVLFTNLGNFKLKLVDLLLEPVVFFANLGKLGSSFAQFFGGLVPILFDFP